MDDNLGNDYYKIALDTLCGAIKTQSRNIQYLDSNRFICGCKEYLFIWNIDDRAIEKRVRTRDEDSISCLKAIDDGNLTIAVGFDSGFISIYRVVDNDYILSESVKIHKSSINFINFHENNSDAFICGGKDGDISYINSGYEMTGSKLLDHKSSISQAIYVSEYDVLISASDSGVIKFWLLNCVHCFKTVETQKHISDFVYVKSKNMLVIGGADQVLDIWKLNWSNFNTTETPNIDYDAVEFNKKRVSVTHFGTVIGENKRRISQMLIDETESILIVNSKEKIVQIYNIRSEQEVQKKLRKRMKSYTKKNKSLDECVVKPDDILHKLQTIKHGFKCEALNLMFEKAKSKLHLVKSMSDNVLEIMIIDLLNDENNHETVFTLHGHRDAILYTKHCEDNEIVTISSNELKTWDNDDLIVTNEICWQSKRDVVSYNNEIYDEIRKELKIDSLVASCAVVLPNDKWVVVGFNNGAIMVFNRKVNLQYSYNRVHKEQITDIRLANLDSHRRHIVLTCSHDKSIRFWTVNFSSHEKTGTILSCQLNEVASQIYDKEITNCAVTFDNKHVLLAFVDGKIKSFYRDNLTRKSNDFYGHTERVTCLTVAPDSTKIVTGSSDKSVRMWSMHFGDAKMFRGHQAAVSCVYFGGSKNSLVISGDTSGVIYVLDSSNAGFTQLQKLTTNGVCVSSLSLTVDKDESYSKLVAGLTNGSLRLFVETTDILIPSDEIITEEEKQMEKEWSNRDEIVVEGGQVSRNFLIRPTKETKDSFDMFIDALEYYSAIQDELDEDFRPPMPNEMKNRNYNELDHVMWILNDKFRNVAEIKTALLWLPLDQLNNALRLFAHVAMRTTDFGIGVYCFAHLLEYHFKMITEDTIYLPILQEMVDYVEVAYPTIRKRFGFIKAKIEFMIRKFKANGEATWIDTKKIKKPKRNNTRREI